MLAFVLIVQTCWIVFTFLYWFNFQIRNHFKAVVTSFFFYYYFSIQWTLLWLGLPSWRLDAALHLSADMLSLQFWLIHRLLLWAVAALPDPSHGFSRHVLVIRQPLPFPQHPLAKGPVMWSVIWGQKWCMHQAEVKKCGLCRILLAHYLLHRLVQGLKKLLRFWKNKGIRWICNKKKPCCFSRFPFKFGYKCDVCCDISVKLFSRRGASSTCLRGALCSDNNCLRTSWLTIGLDIQ